MKLKIFQKGSTLGGILLISGSCIGAGMLALPIITGLGGFFSSLVTLFICWIFMTFTGLILLEINSWFTQRVNIVSMAGKSFGFIGRAISWILYLFLFYSLIVAYISGCGNILSSAIDNIFSWAISPQIVAVFFVIFFGVVIYLGTTPVDYVNRVLMFGLIATYIGIIILGSLKIHVQNFFHFNIEYSLIGLPILVTSFGFHNMIPSIVSYMDYDYKKVRKVIIGGSILVFFIYLFWVTIVLGMVPFTNLFASYAGGIEASQMISKYLKSTWTGFFVQSFAFFAIVTSFLAQGLSLLHFIADGVKVDPNRKNSLWLIFLALVPPTVFSVTYPSIFFKALSFAGGICAVVLFCILPALMVWKGRYRQQLVCSYKVCGGKFALVLVIAFSLFIMIQEVLRLIFS